MMPRRLAKPYGYGLVVLLAGSALLGVEAWPLTEWRLFSLSRDDTQRVWVLEAVDGDGEATPVDLESLPMAYRNAEWVFADLPGARAERREEVCRALLDEVVEVRPATTALRLVRDGQLLVVEDGDRRLLHDPEPFHECSTGDTGDTGDTGGLPGPGSDGPGWAGDDG